MPGQEFAIVHAVEMIAGKYEQRIDTPVANVREHLTYSVGTNILKTSELMQFEIAISTSRYLPPSGTAGLDRCCVSGNKRFPAPPPRITASRLCFAGIALSPNDAN